MSQDSSQPTSLQALGVPVIQFGAGPGRLASSRTSPAISTTLLPVSGKATRRAGVGRGARSGIRVGVGIAAVITAEGGANRTNLDVGVDNVGVGMLGFDLSGDTRVCGAGTAGNARDGGVSVDGIVAVQPEHVGVVVIPDAKHKGHAQAEGLTHIGHTAMRCEHVDVVENVLLRIAKLGGKRISWDTGDGGLSVGNDFAILDVETLDLGQGAGVSSVISQKLGNESEWGVGIDDATRAIEGLISLAESIEVTSIGVAGTAISVVTVCPTARVSSAPDLPGLVAWVRSECRRDAVGLPNVHLSTARAMITGTGIGIGR